MTKRGEKRHSTASNPRDFWPTPLAAVRPLLPHLRIERVRTFAEPCCGEGDLVRHLESFGLQCRYQGDIATGQDALACDEYGGADAIVTNPPFSKASQPLLRELIAHFQAIAPTWLLLPFDFGANRWFAPYMSRCSDVVQVGRVKWIAGSAGGGFENDSWFRFDARHRGVTRIHARWAVTGNRICPCGQLYMARRSTAQFCSDRCRQRAHRAGACDLEIA
jgi:hypothetical protein